MQAKRDIVATTLGWSFIGSLSGAVVVQALDARQSKIKSMRLVGRREFTKVGAFAAHPTHGRAAPFR